MHARPSYRGKVKVEPPNERRSRAPCGRAKLKANSHPGLGEQEFLPASHTHADRADDQWLYLRRRPALRASSRPARAAFRRRRRRVSRTARALLMVLLGATALAPLAAHADAERGLAIAREMNTRDRGFGDSTATMKMVLPSWEGQARYATQWACAFVAFQSFVPT